MEFRAEYHLGSDWRTKMKMRVLRWATLAASTGVMLQLAGCGGDFLIRFAGAGAVVSGLRTLLAG